MLIFDYKVVPEDFKFLCNEYNGCLLDLKESLSIKGNKHYFSKSYYCSQYSSLG